MVQGCVCNRCCRDNCEWGWSSYCGYYQPAIKTVDVSRVKNGLQSDHRARCQTQRALFFSYYQGCTLPITPQNQLWEKFLQRPSIIQILHRIHPAPPLRKGELLIAVRRRLFSREQMVSILSSATSSTSQSAISPAFISHPL